MVVFFLQSTHLKYFNQIMEDYSKAKVALDETTNSGPAAVCLGGGRKMRGRKPLRNGSCTNAPRLSFDFGLKQPTG
ncbi:MAG: hypothetical protein ACJAZ9_001979 [Neolewinella sp.]|jgi:hypothetical protein